MASVMLSSPSSFESQAVSQAAVIPSAKKRRFRVKMASVRSKARSPLQLPRVKDASNSPMSIEQVSGALLISFLVELMLIT